jgi:protein TonB
MRRFVLLSVFLHAAVLAAWLPGAKHPGLPGLIAAELVGAPLQRTPVSAVAAHTVPPRNSPVAVFAPRATVPTAQDAIPVPRLPTGDGGHDVLANQLQLRVRGLLAEQFRYPPLARRNGWEGRVELLLALDHNGEIHALRVARSSGYAILDEDALATVKRLGSHPETRAELGGCDCELRVPVLYRLIEG